MAGTEAGWAVGAVPRAEMPQISRAKAPEFLAWIAGAGAEVTHEEVAAASLAKTQAEILSEKVAAMVACPERVAAKEVLASADGYVLDGHHHWAAKAAMGEKVKVARIGIEMAELLRIASAWAEAS